MKDFSLKVGILILPRPSKISNLFSSLSRPSPSSINFMDYLENIYSESCFFSPATPSEVKNLLKSLNENKAPDAYGLNTTLPSNLAYDIPVILIK